MPYKLNSAGKMQPYDEKGRFARIEANIISQDNKPLKENKEMSKITSNVINDKYHIETTNERLQRVKDNINRVNKSNISNETILDNYNCGTKEAQELVDMVLERDDFTIEDGVEVSFADIWGRNCSFNKEALALNNEYDVDGRCFYHEMGHALDGSFQKYYNKDGMPLTISSVAILSNGLTLGGTIRKEAIDLMINRKFEKMEKDYNNREKELWLQNGISMEDAIKRKNEIHYKVREENKNLSNEKIDEILYKNEEFRKISNLENKIENQLYKEYGDLDDIRTAFGEEHLGNIKTNHDKEYWEEQRARVEREFFAECFSAKATSPKSWKLLNKYFPNSCKAFEELIDKIKNKEIKMR